MRTKALSANQRIRIGDRTVYACGEETRVLARVLTSVGLTLEIEPHPTSVDRVILYAARRPVTHTIRTPDAPTPTARVGEGEL